MAGLRFSVDGHTMSGNGDPASPEIGTVAYRDKRSRSQTEFGTHYSPRDIRLRVFLSALPAVLCNALFRRPLGCLEGHEISQRPAQLETYAPQSR